MSGSIERRLDGSIALTIDGDLQFDSRDEHIYHEGLVMPALGIASIRTEESLNVLIVGGGDGLTAKQIFKSNRISRATIVDYDAEILSMAKNDFAELNANSMLDARLLVVNEDAWAFAEKELKSERRYDLIVVDLTVADSIESAKFHSVEWYKMLKSLLTEKGVLATNGVSAQATPWSYCSILNSILISGLHARPYHVSIPSFCQRGFGDDWGFFLASSTLISADELTEAAMPEPRSFLIDADNLHRLFDLPESLYEIQPVARPAHAGSDVLLRYFRAGSLTEANDSVKNSFSIEYDRLSIADADTGKDVLPKELSLALAKMLNEHSSADTVEQTSQQAVLDEILELVPSLATSQTPEMVRDFLSQPAAFLQSIDITDLVGRLTTRLSALPASLAAELKLLAQKLADWNGDEVTLMQMGRNVVTLLSLLLIVGNLLYPDMAYAKADGHHAAHRGGRGGGWNAWNAGGGGVTYYNRRNVVLPNPQTGLPTRKAPIEPEIRNYGGKKKSALPNKEQRKLVFELDQTLNMLAADVSETTDYSMVLLDELSQYENSSSGSVTYGLAEVSKEEAVRRTQQLLNKTRIKIVSLNQQIARIEEQRDEIIAAADEAATAPDLMNGSKLSADADIVEEEKA